MKGESCLLRPSKRQPNSSVETTTLMMSFPHLYVSADAELNAVRKIKKTKFSFRYITPNKETFSQTDATQNT